MGDSAALVILSISGAITLALIVAREVLSKVTELINAWSDVRTALRKSRDEDGTDV